MPSVWVGPKRGHCVLGKGPGIQQHERIDLIQRMFGAVSININSSDEAGDLSLRCRYNLGDRSACHAHAHTWSAAR